MYLQSDQTSEVVEQTSEVVEGHVWYTYREVRLVRLWKTMSGTLTEWSD